MRRNFIICLSVNIFFILVLFNIVASNSIVYAVSYYCVSTMEECTSRGGNVMWETSKCGGCPSVDQAICCENPSGIPSPTSIRNIGELITKVSGITTPLAVIGFIFSVIYAGFVRMTAAGNPEKEAKSMKIAIAAAVGFIIIALAPLFVKILGEFLEVDQTLVQ